MPWKETRVVDERLRFIVAVNETEESFAELCRQFGISRKTGYKWANRYEEFGPAGLEDRPPIPRNIPHATPPAMVDLIVELRKEHPTWGPKKLRARLQTLGHEGVPAASTIGDILKKHGLIRPRRRRVHPPMSPSQIEVPERPNDTWCVDFKGHFALGDSSRCHPLTITDEVSRYVLKCEGLERPNEAFAKPHFDRAFREFGLPRRIRSDNGAPFATAGIGGLSKLAVHWIKLGIHPERIEPGKPEQNGRHERMHRTLKEETAKPPASTLLEQQRRFDRFRRIFNDERPHEALGQRPPASLYTPSPRTMPYEPSSPEYPDNMLVRRLSRSGLLNLGGSQTLVTRLLAQEPVGLLPVEEDVWELYYGPVLLAQVTLKNKELRVQKAR